MPSKSPRNTSAKLPEDNEVFTTLPVRSLHICSRKSAITGITLSWKAGKKSWFVIELWIHIQVEGNAHVELCFKFNDDGCGNLKWSGHLGDYSESEELRIQSLQTEPAKIFLTNLLLQKMPSAVSDESHVTYGTISANVTLFVLVMAAL